MSEPLTQAEQDRDWYQEGTCEHGIHLTRHCAKCEQAYYDELDAED